ncbi:MAG: carbohydrate-binding family 9-like protein [Bacteroidales bacterium]|nr:carbohydrate-binding family 9-like protein [Bacteroidales bacterium]
MISTKFYLTGLPVTLCVAFGLQSCSGPQKPIESSALNFPPQPVVKEYVCYKTATPVIPDGLLDEPAWLQVPWTDYFADIEGTVKPEPRYKTRAKMLWDDTNLYIAAELEDPHVWAHLKQRDTVIFYDNDFEVFIDPDDDTHAYYELEVNALGTAWELLLLKPYRDGGPAVNGWDIAGLKVGTHIDGTLNNPADRDKGWTVELCLPLEALKECAKDGKVPVAGDHWRINFSRVEWRTLVENGRYRKEINPKTGKAFPEDNWVWSPQGRVNMHMPEMWGALQFSSIIAGTAQEKYVRDSSLNTRWALRMVYYAEFAYFEKHKTYSGSLSEIGLKPTDFAAHLSLPVIHSTTTTFECSIPDSKGNQGWTIYQDGKIIDLAVK